MVTDDTHPEDVAEHPLDHAPDALRYGLMSRPAPTKPLPKVHPTMQEKVIQHINNFDRQAKKKKRSEYAG